MSDRKENKTQKMIEQLQKNSVHKRMTHQEAKERNERFKQFIKDKSVQAQLADVKATKRLKLLMDLYKAKSNEDVPRTAAYKVMNEVTESKTNSSKWKQNFFYSS